MEPGISQAGIFISISHTLKGFPFIQVSSLCKDIRLKNPTSHFPVYMSLFHGILLFLLLTAASFSIHLIFFLLSKSLSTSSPSCVDFCGLGTPLQTSDFIQLSEEECESSPTRTHCSVHVSVQQLLVADVCEKITDINHTCSCNMFF